MKTLIIKPLIVAFVAGIQVEACAWYADCRCTMADGSIDNNITSKACATYHTNAGMDDNETTAFTTEVDGNNTTWCKAGMVDYKYTLYLDNCHMREYCTGAGATGNDSWCEKKQL
ncbi:hypothetical protein LZ32DRAFT_612075 [Colletotrichum eremochloae]|nr:hypothetical protein LZ32DRAFT_612116 [Colletotrichum eremochloae]KAK2005475.1 hypothetical protein LZ32DRAFT_612075 [Colletotrichum eremochloae]